MDLGRWLYVGKGSDMKSPKPSSNCWVLISWRVMETLFVNSSNKYLPTTYYMVGTIKCLLYRQDIDSVLEKLSA